MLKRFPWVLVIAFLAALVLSACETTDEHSKSKSEHPQQEHPGTNAPPKTS